MDRAGAKKLLEDSPGFYGRLSAAEREIVLRILSGEGPDGAPEPFEVASAPAGDFGYLAGADGHVHVDDGVRVVGLSCQAGPDGGQVTINAGDVIPVAPAGAFAARIEGRLVAPTIDFVGTLAYFVELVVP